MISMVSLRFNDQLLDGDVSSPTHSADLQRVCGLNMSKTAALDTFTIQSFICTCIVYMPCYVQCISLIPWLLLVICRFADWFCLIVTGKGR